MHARALLLAALAFATPAGAQRLDDHTILVPGGVAPGRQPDGNSVLLETRDGLVVFDTGRHKSHSDAILAASAGRPIRAIVNSHWHLDHVSGNLRLKPLFPGLKVYGTGAIDGALSGFLKTSAEQGRAALAGGKLSSGIAEDVRGDLTTIEAGAGLRPDLVVAERTALSFGGRTFLIHVAPHDQRRRTIRAAQDNLQGMYEAYDWILGLAKPELGGDASLADVVGLNFYPHNQWYFDGPTIPMGHHEYRPLADMLVEFAERYGKPVFISETGAEGTGRPAWLHYVCDEVREAQARGTRVEGICLYPITAYPGWDNSRHCEVGLFSSIQSDGSRHVYEPLRAELERQRKLVMPERLGDRRRLRLV